MEMRRGEVFSCHGLVLVNVLALLKCDYMMNSNGCFWHTVMGVSYATIA